MSKNIIHGGDLDTIQKNYNIPKNEIIDFSGNINPLGFPEGVKNKLSKNIDIVTKYPDKNYEALKNSVGKYIHINPRHIAVGNGSTELISAFIKTAAPKKSLILGPSYSEYEKELKIVGSKYEYFPLEEKNGFVLDAEKLLARLTPGVGLFIACNPNNPTGTYVPVSSMELILKHCKANGTFVMIDETYIEFSDNLEEICCIPLTEKYDNLFVIRGVSKFFAAPGLRLGYGISGNKSFHEELKAVQNPWSVNIFAAFSGELLFDEKEFIKTSRALISQERERALKELKSWKNVRVYDSVSNFILFKLLSPNQKSSDIFEKFITDKMLIRDASSFTFLDDSFIRFCLLKPEHNKKLIEKLKSAIEGVV